MQDFLQSLGISNELLNYLLMPLLIFVARVSDVSINTLRFMFMMNGKKNIVPILGFFETMIWLLAIGQIFQNIDNPLSYLAYAGGFAMGNYVGMTLEETNLRKEYKVTVITIIHEMERTNMLGKKSIIKKVVGVVNGDTKIEAGDILVLFGSAKDIQQILEM